MALRNRLGQKTDKELILCLFFCVERGLARQLDPDLSNDV